MNTSSMYLNKFSSGTILALLALSGMLVLVPIAAPAHATNGSPLQLAYAQGAGSPLAGGTTSSGVDNYMEITITNPATNSYAVTGFTIAFSMPGFTASSWDVYDCDTATSNTFWDCSVSNQNTAAWFYGGASEPTYPGILPGTSSTIEVWVETPSITAGTTYPLTATITSTVQDASSAAYYTGPSINTQVISDDSGIAYTLTPGGSNTATSFTAGTAPYSISAKVTCGVTADGCPSSGYEAGVQMFFVVGNETSGDYQTSGLSVTSGSTGATGTLSTVLTPGNHAGQEIYAQSSFGAGGVIGGEVNQYSDYFDDDYVATASITTVPGAPALVGFSLSGSTFPTTDYLGSKGTTTNTNGAGTYTGAALCVATQQSCTGANPVNTAVGVSVTDRFGNAETYGVGGVTFVGAQTIMVQTASGGLFDTTNLPSSISCGVTALFNCPVAGVSAPEPFNYYQGATYATAGVFTATISGTYGGSSFSVSGSSGTIQTSTFAPTGSFETTGHAAFVPINVKAGSSTTFEVILSIAQTGVPVKVAVCDNGTCAATTKGYSGTITTASGVTNSSGDYSTSLKVDTKAEDVAVLNATVLAPTNALPKHSFVIGPSAAITTIAGAAAKFTVVVGSTGTLTPSPITNSIPGATTFVNVIVSDAYGNGVSTPGAQQVQVNLVATPNTITVTSAYIPTNCYETNGTSGQGCSAGFGSFGPIAWTLPATVGGTATITATGVLNGVLVTSATDTINIVSKLPTLSVFSPKPLSNVIYSGSVNVQFRGWANASVGYNGAAMMSTLGWKVGTATWQNTALAGKNTQWSVIATLPTGLSTVTFNATDNKGNVVVSSTYSVLVDTSAPTITNVTPAGSVLTPGQLFSATIVDSEGDLNATTVAVSYNGTSLPASAITVSGTNNPGTSVTYTVTAALPTSVGNPGHWSVAVSASDLAGNTATGPSDLITVTVAFGDSITFNTAGATYGPVGAYKGVTVSVTNLWNTPQTIVVFATLRSGTSIYVAQGTVTVGSGQTASVFCADLGIVPAGTYTVTFAAVTTSNLAVSAPTTPITVTAT